VYAHCSAASAADVTLLLLNLNAAALDGSTTNATVVLPSAFDRVEYHLTGPKGTDATALALNGKLLSMTVGGRLPELEGAASHGKNVQLAAASIAFVVLKGAGAAAGCTK
jgi:hypothetical protein